MSALKLIQGWKWFAHVPAADQQWFAERGVSRALRAGEQVYETGAPVTHVFAVEEGVLRVYLASRLGDEITLEEAIGGSWVPHVMQVPDPRHVMMCVAAQDTTVWVFPYAAFRELGARAPGLFRGLYEEFTDRAIMITARIELLTLHSLDVRLAVHLMRMAHLRGEKRADGSLWVPLPTSQSEIGARVGGTRQNVNIILKAWDKQGWLSLAKGGVTIFDAKALSALVRKSGFELEPYLASWHGGWQGGNSFAATNQER